jgi:ribose transport system permease protein
MGLPFAVLFGRCSPIRHVAGMPGFVNGSSSRGSRCRPSSARSACSAWPRRGLPARGRHHGPGAEQLLRALGNGRFYIGALRRHHHAVFVLVMHYLLSQTRFGQHNYAIGANEQAARRAGIDVKSHLLRLYILSGMCAGLAGFLYAARFSAGAAQAGEPLLLDSVAAVVIGGASLFGGSGTILGTVAGALVIAVIQYGLVFMNVQTLLAIHLGRRRHHHLGPDRPGPAQLRRGTAE